MRFLPSFLRPKTRSAEVITRLVVPMVMPRLTQPVATVARAAGLREVGQANTTLVMQAGLQENRFVDVMTFLAHGLPARDAVRWAADSCELSGPLRTSADANALTACRAWIAQPGVVTAAQAAQAAVASQYRSPAGWAA